MARKKLTAAAYIEKYDGEMRIILAELAENAAKINLWWTFACSKARRYPDRAMTDLIDAEIYLNNHVQIELADSLRRVRAAISLLDAELPDDADTPSATQRVAE
jgi:hypothetical protein